MSSTEALIICNVMYDTTAASKLKIHIICAQVAYMDVNVMNSYTSVTSYLFLRQNATEICIIVY